MKILIIEDSSPSAYLLASMCESVGREVDIACTMAEGWKRLKSGDKYDVVFLDLGLTDSMPHESLAIVPEMRQYARVVIVTGYMNPEYRTLAVLADAFFLKDDPDFADKVLAQIGTPIVVSENA